MGLHAFSAISGTKCELEMKKREKLPIFPIFAQDMNYCIGGVEMQLQYWTEAN